MLFVFGFVANLTSLGCRGLPAPDAETLYMQEVERMEGYGGESYPAKVGGARREAGLSRGRWGRPGRPAVQRLKRLGSLEM